MRRPDGAPWIHSFAHGRTIYELKLDAAALRKAMEAAAKSDVAKAFCWLAVDADLDAEELEELRQLAKKLSDTALVLLCHKFWCPFRAAQHGQRESVVARAATNLRRIVAIEFGTWRSGRNGGSSGLVTFA